MSRTAAFPAELVPGTLIGHRANGDPIFYTGGAAPADLDDWTPIEYDSEVWHRVLQTSVIEREAAPVPMVTKTKSQLRSEGLKVRFGRTYSDDDSERTSYFLKARKIISRVTLDEDDLADASALVDVLAANEIDYAISYATLFDHACLGVTGTESDVEDDQRPFTSLYRMLRDAHTENPNLDYVTDQNYVAWDGTRSFSPGGADGESFYEKASDMFARVETGRHWSPQDSIVIADPAFRDVFRTTTNAQGDPIFRENAGVDRTGAPVDYLFSAPIAWTHGARTGATASQAPDGNPLMFYGNRRALKRGDREGLRTLFSEARAQDDVDEASVKFRSRKGFAVAHPRAWAVLEEQGAS